MNRIADFVVGGWQVSGIVRLSSGLPVRLTAPSTISQYGFRAQYPNLTKGSDVPVANQTPEHWFNTAGFPPAPYTVPERAIKTTLTRRSRRLTERGPSQRAVRAEGGLLNTQRPG